LKKKPEGHADNEGNGKVQENGPTARVELPESDQERKGVSRRYPPAENKTSHYAGETASYHRPPPSKFPTWLTSAYSAADPKTHPYRHPKAEKITNKLWEMSSSILEHHVGTSPSSRKMKKTAGGEYPQQERRTQSPDESCTRARGAPGEKQSKCKSKGRPEEPAVEP
jgi:hypothetical protein